MKLLQLILALLSQGGGATPTPVIKRLVDDASNVLVDDEGNTLTY